MTASEPTTCEAVTPAETKCDHKAHYFTTDGGKTYGICYPDHALILALEKERDGLRAMKRRMWILDAQLRARGGSPKGWWSDRLAISDKIRAALAGEGKA